MQGRSSCVSQRFLEAELSELEGGLHPLSQPDLPALAGIGAVELVESVVIGVEDGRKTVQAFEVETLQPISEALRARTIFQACPKVCYGAASRERTLGVDERALE